MLKLDKLRVRYGNAEVLGGLNLTLEQGRIHALIGPSGCGKSTLLKVLAGILRPSSGVISYNGQALTPGSLTVGYVPQNYGLLPWKTLEHNIYLPLKVGPKALRPSADVRREQGPAIISALGLDGLLQRYPREVSGGQQQRAALARAFIMQPGLLLMDEPFSALDAFTSAASRELFLELWRKYRLTTLFITHNMREAADVGQRILLMGREAGGSGGIIAELDNPAFGSADERLKSAMVGRMSELLQGAAAGAAHA